jgi:hypothetical protein
MANRQSAKPDRIARLVKQLNLSGPAAMNAVIESLRPAFRSKPAFERAMKAVSEYTKSMLADHMLLLELAQAGDPLAVELLSELGYELENQAPPAFRLRPRNHSDDGTLPTLTMN